MVGTISVAVTVLLFDGGHHQFRVERPDDHVGAAADQRGEYIAPPLARWNIGAALR